MKLYNVGLVTDDNNGLNLATIIAKGGFTVSLYYTGFGLLTQDEQKKLMSSFSGYEINIVPDEESFMISLELPRKIFTYSLSESFNSYIIKNVLPQLDKGDALANLCDMNFKEAGLIVEEQKKRDVYYLPTGLPRGDISFSAGISLMPGGDYSGFELMRPVFSEIAARDEEGFMCSPYIGPGGSGQYVNMVIKGLEYSLLEIDYEMISLIKHLCGVKTDDMIEILTELNSTESESFFLEMFTDIYSRDDELTGKPIISVVSDFVEYGRGVCWLSDEGISLGMPLSIVNASLELRFISALKNERIASSRLIGDIAPEKVPEQNRRLFLERVRKAAYLAGICAFSQCFGILRRASEIYKWDLDLLAISRTMQINSYTRSRLLNRVIEAFDRHNKLMNLFTDPYFQKCASAYSGSLRFILKAGISAGIPVPAMSASVQYIDLYRSSDLNSGIIQLSRDYVNSAGYQRNDIQGLFHGNWNEHKKTVSQTGTGN